MSRVIVVLAGLLVGIGVMLAVLKPWQRKPERVIHITLPAPAPDPFAPAREFIEAGKFDDARAMLKQYLIGKPDSALSYALLALVDIKAGDPKSAEERLARAAELDDTLFEVPLYQGHLHMLQRDHRAAVRSYDEALQKNPADGATKVSRATARFELKEYAGAILDANDALAGDPRDADAYFIRASAYGAMGRNDEALRDWTSYIAFKPKDAQGWVNRGNVHQRGGRREAAVADWSQAVKLDPELREQLDPLINQ